MIKEFWQERKEEKRKQKELKKQNKKLPQSKEQRAYKVFGVLFALFLIFGSLFYTCRGIGDVDEYSWDQLIGITDEMKEKLSSRVDKSALIENKELSIIDWSDCKDLMELHNLNVITNDNIDIEILNKKDNILTSEMSLKKNLLGTLVSNMIEQGLNKNKIDLIELTIFQDGNQPMLRTLFNVNLSYCFIIIRFIIFSKFIMSFINDWSIFIFIFIDISYVCFF